MRRPTPRAGLGWHAAALRDGRLPRHEDEPQPGTYRMRIVAGGPWVPVLIWLDQPTDPETGELVAPETLHALVGSPERGERVDPARIWTRCRPIPREAWEALVALVASSPAMEATHVRLPAEALALGPRREPRHG